MMACNFFTQSTSYLLCIASETSSLSKHQTPLLPQVRSDILDWHGDHPATNFHDMYDALRDAGYFLEILGSPLSCFDAKQVKM